MRNWGFECTASADTVCREGTGKEGRGSKMGGGVNFERVSRKLFFSNQSKLLKMQAKLSKTSS